MITGKILAEAIFKDVENFFFHSKNFSIKKEYFATMREHASCAGKEQNIKIKLSEGFCNFCIEDIDCLFFVSLILCHEIAHYINFHNTHKDNSQEDTKAIESRADNFGATIFMVIITYGNKTTVVMKQLFEYTNGIELVPHIGKALGDLYRKVFLLNPHNNYPPPLYRAYSIIVGFLSFFFRGHGTLSEEFTKKFILKILRSSELNNQTLNDEEENSADIITKKIKDIHKEIQKEQPLMINGMKPLYGRFLISDFQQSPEAQKQHKKKLEQMIFKFDLYNEVAE